MAKLLRRSISISTVLGMAVLAWSVAPVLVPVLLGIDLVGAGPRLARTRAYTFFLLYLVCEVLGVLAAGGLWVITANGALTGKTKTISLYAGLQRWWSDALFWGAVRIYGMRVDFETAPQTFAGPQILLVRHASTADTVLAAALLANPYRILFRYVIKQELLWDPCLDLVGHQLPNAFIDRGLHDKVALTQQVAALAQSLDTHSGVLIFPEGTRYSMARLAELKAKRSELGGPVTQAVEKLQHTLPPRTAGVRALVATAPEAGLAILGHTGLEAARSFWEFWGGGLVGRTIHVRLWQFAPGEIPQQGLDVWLMERWIEMDTWIADKKAARDNVRS